MPVVDRNFAIVADDGSIRYPYKKEERATRRFGFAISKPGSRDAHGGAEYTDDLAEVVRRVVLDGWKVRASTSDGAKKGSIGVGKLRAHEYWVAPSLRPIVASAEIPPLADQPRDE